MSTVAREPEAGSAEDLPATLSELYEVDETAWLERMSLLAAGRRHEEFDFENLCEFLQSLAIRDRREMRSRLVKLLMHLLKWEHQPAKRTGSWRRTIREQRQQLADVFTSKTLRNHAEAILSGAYRQAVELASAETGLDASEFPTAFAGSLDDALRRDLPAWDRPRQRPDEMSSIRPTGSIPRSTEPPRVGPIGAGSLAEASADASAVDGGAGRCDRSDG